METETPGPASPLGKLLLEDGGARTQVLRVWGGASSPTPALPQLSCLQVDAFTHLYTLVLRPDLTYEVRVDGQAVESGSVEYDWQLASLRSVRRAAAAREQQEGARQAQDWDQQFLDASTASKGAQGLDGALLQKPPYQDGLKAEGIAPDVWLHQSPGQHGYWAQDDLTEFENIGAIGLDLWQVRSGSIFDNFLITDDEDYAQRFGQATWGETKDPEREMDDVQAKEEARRAQEEDEEDMRAGRRGRGPRDGL